MFSVVQPLALLFVLDVVSTVCAQKNISDKKFVLQWLPNDGGEETFLMPTGDRAFVECAWDNCYITRSKFYLDDESLFDAILFRAEDLPRITAMPQKREPRQKYVFVSQEPASYHPFPFKMEDNFFNVTWTYKLDSDVTFRNLLVKNLNGDQIGPKRRMKWLSFKEMLPTSEATMSKLQHKFKAVAWIESNCKSLSLRETYVTQLRHELAQYGLMLDTYGPCGQPCPHGVLEGCLRLVEREYYFYLAFEKAFDEDYVTDIVLHALQNYAVPIVFGGANYGRFLPIRSYINAVRKDPIALAKQISDLIDDPKAYAEYFRWRNHYKYFNPRTDPNESEYCGFCELLNNKNLMNQPTVYVNLAEWWNRPSTYRAFENRSIAVSSKYSNDKEPEHTHQKFVADNNLANYIPALYSKHSAIMNPNSTKYAKITKLIPRKVLSKYDLQTVTIKNEHDDIDDVDDSDSLAYGDWYDDNAHVGSNTKEGWLRDSRGLNFFFNGPYKRPIESPAQSPPVKSVAEKAIV